MTRKTSETSRRMRIVRRILAARARLNHARVMRDKIAAKYDARIREAHELHDAARNEFLKETGIEWPGPTDAEPTG